MKVKTAAWRRSEGKSKSGGLNEKGRKSYHAETGEHKRSTPRHCQQVDRR